MGRPLRLLQITDTHLFADPAGRLKGVTTETTARAVIESARRRCPAPDLVLATGDLVHDGSRAGYERLRALFSVFDAPVACLPGNHDDGRTLREVLSEGQVRWYRHLDLAGWRCVFLDSTRPGEAGGHLAPEELAALEACLGEGGASHVLVCLHHPPVRVGSAWLDSMLVDNGPALLELLRGAPRVRALVCGHIHQALDVDLDGLRLLGAPSTCIQFLPDSRDFALDPAPPGYRWLELHADGRLDTGIERLDALPPGLELTLERYD